MWQFRTAEGLLRYKTFLKTHFVPQEGPTGTKWEILLIFAHACVAQSNGMVKVIETQRLILRPWRENDAEALFKYAGEPIGCCGQVKPTEIGYWIGRPYWCQGLMPEAVKALLDMCFNDFHAEAIWCAHFEGNNKSKRVIEKCGFKYHHSEDVISPLGDKRTEHFYVITASDHFR